MSILRKIIPVVSMFLLAKQTQAQQHVVTLPEALQYALKNSEVIKQARLDIENGFQKVNETRASALPQISGVSQVTANPIVQQFVLPASAFGGPADQFIAIKAGQTWTAMSQVQLSQQLFNQQLFTGLKAAKGSAQYYELAQKMSEENVLQLVATNYYQLIITRQKLRVVDANMSTIGQVEKTLQTQYDNGLAKRIDLDRIKVNKANIDAQKTTLENAIVQMENLLKYYMGMPISEPITVVETGFDEIDKNILPSVSNDQLDLNNLVSYKILKKQEELLGLQKQAAVSEYFPSLSLGANYIYNTQSNEFNLYSKKALSYDMASVSLTLRVPLFDGLGREARIQQSKIALYKSQEEIRKNSNALTMAFENAKNQLKNSLKTIQVQKANKELAEEVFASTQNNYKNGLATLTDLLNAETELVAAQNSYNEALLQYKVAEIELIKANGNIRDLLK